MDQQIATDESGLATPSCASMALMHLDSASHIFALLSSGSLARPCVSLSVLEGTKRWRCSWCVLRSFQSLCDAQGQWSLLGHVFLPRTTRSAHPLVMKVRSMRGRLVPRLKQLRGKWPTTTL